jgi:hypothetical protein
MGDDETEEDVGPEMITGTAWQATTDPLCSGILS